MEPLKVIWALNRLPGFGVQKFKRLREQLDDLRKLSDSETIRKLSSSPEWSFEFVHNFQEIFESNEFECEIDYCAQHGIHIVSLLDSDYPKNLAAIYDPPLILYVKGSLVPEDQVAIAVVGSRHSSTYGLKCSSRFASALAECGVTIVSGFARGIDGEAHRAALRAKGRTIAVLGCGLDVIYPKEHASLYEEIAADGALVGELPFGTPPQAFNFPRRNRLISGLSMGVLVVEASLRSGSLITARLATEEGREVYAIPGQIDSLTSIGTNALIQTGAKLVSRPEDILEDLFPQIRASLSSKTRHCEKSRRDDEAIPDLEIASASIETLPRPPKDVCLSADRDPAIVVADNDEDPLLKLLTDEPLSFDEIALGLQENPVQIQSRLTQLELQGMVRRIFGGRYVRS